MHKDHQELLCYKNQTTNVKYKMIYNFECDAEFLRTFFLNNHIPKMLAV